MPFRHQPYHCIGPTLHIEDAPVDNRLASKLSKRGDIAGDDGCTASHRFQQR